jgi:hypothetical protein
VRLVTRAPIPVRSITRAPISIYPRVEILSFVSKNAALRVLCRYVEMLSSRRKRASCTSVGSFQVKFSEDQCGYGGRIREKRVARFLEEQGLVSVKDPLGVRASPHLAFPILPISISATTSNVPLTSMHARATPLPPATHYTHEATIDFTVTTSFEIENYNHR